MRLIDRLYQYLEHQNITAYAFEHSCGIANGYLKKQYNGKGTIGSKILDKIHHHYPDLNTLWLLTGEGEMIQKENPEVREDDKKYRTIKDEMIALLQQQVLVMKKSLEDKDKIIGFLEEKLKSKKKNNAP